MQSLYCYCAYSQINLGERLKDLAMINFGFVLRRNNNGLPDFVVNFKKGEYSSFPFETKAIFKLRGELPQRSPDQETICLDFDLDFSVGSVFLLPHKFSSENLSWRTFDDGLAVFKDGHIPLMHVVLNFKAKVKIKGLLNHNEDSHLYGHAIESVEMELDNSISVVESLIIDSTSLKQAYKHYNVSLDSIIDDKLFNSKNQVHGVVEAFKHQILIEKEVTDFLRDLKDSDFSIHNGTHQNSFLRNLGLRQPQEKVDSIPFKPFAFLKKVFA